jgi:hypothetical protein
LETLNFFPFPAYFLLEKMISQFSAIPYLNCAGGLKVDHCFKSHILHLQLGGSITQISSIFTNFVGYYEEMECDSEAGLLYEGQ